MCKDTVFYFCPVPEEFRDQHAADLGEDSNWDPDFYFRIRVVYGEEEIKIEDSCGRMVPFCFEHMKALRRTLKTIKELV